MGKFFYIMGKSASGKDTVYRGLLRKKELGLRPLVSYTTRPVRTGETDGVQYHFVDTGRMEQMEREGRIIERRAYHTVHGIWYYFTADDEGAGLGQEDYAVLGTLESYVKMRDYYGEERVVPIYIEVEDGERLSRALARERQEEKPEYEELCRRFLADQEDFSEEKLRLAGIRRRFSNDGETVRCVEEIAAYVTSHKASHPPKNMV